MKSVVLIFLSWAAIQVVGDSANAADALVDKTYFGQGNLVSVRLVLGEGKMKVFLIGREAARLDFNKQAKLLSLSALGTDGTKQELRFSERDGYYLVDEVPTRQSLTMSVSAKIADQQEQVRIKVEKAP